VRLTGSVERIVDGRLEEWKYATVISANRGRIIKRPTTNGADRGGELGKPAHLGRSGNRRYRRWMGPSNPGYCGPQKWDAQGGRHWRLWMGGLTRSVLNARG